MLGDNRFEGTCSLKAFGEAASAGLIHSILQGQSMNAITPRRPGGGADDCDRKEADLEARSRQCA
jgi:hypothetical protein